MMSSHNGGGRSWAGSCSRVDRQTKGSYTTAAAAQSAALAIKTGHPIVQVSVYDAVDNSTTIVEAPTTAGHVTRGSGAASAIKG